MAGTRYALVNIRMGYELPADENGMLEFRGATLDVKKIARRDKLEVRRMERAIIATSRELEVLDLQAELTAWKGAKVGAEL